LDQSDGEPSTVTNANANANANANGAKYKYDCNIPTLRSSCHRVRQPTKAKKIQNNEPQPKRTSTTRGASSASSSSTTSSTISASTNVNGENGTMLPASIRKVEHIPYDTTKHDFNRAIILFLKSLDPTIVGDFRETENDNKIENGDDDNTVKGNFEHFCDSKTKPNGDETQQQFQSLSLQVPTLENFEVPIQSLKKKSKRGILLAQDHLSQAMYDCFFGESKNSSSTSKSKEHSNVNNENGGGDSSSSNSGSSKTSLSSSIVDTFDDFVTQLIIPHLKSRLIKNNIIPESSTVKFYYQRPPTLRIQPGPARARVNRHKDKDYGHQNGELNFWIPLTNRLDTGVDLYVESIEDKGDYEPLKTDVGYASSFFGSGCSHFVNENKSQFTRVSLDFRVGIEPFFDPVWSKVGTRDDHLRRCIEM